MTKEQKKLKKALAPLYKFGYRELKEWQEFLEFLDGLKKACK